MNETPDPATREAFEYWGYLFRNDKCGTDTLNRLLSGIANYISANFEPQPDCEDITPAQLARFYKAVGGDYDILFLATPAPSVAFIYKSIGCLHSLQPAPGADGYSVPLVPALKRKGFITWQTIQLLLGPDEHVPFLQRAVELFDIKDPTTGELFPKLLPKESFPEQPDKDMVNWYEGVSNRLRKEAEAEEAKQRPPTGAEERTHRTSSDFSADESFEETRKDANGAADYFRNPLYRDRGGRPTIIRSYSRAPPRSPREYVTDRGKAVANTIKQWTPWGGKERHKSLPDHRHRGSSSFEDVAGEYDEPVQPSTGGHSRHQAPAPADAVPSRPAAGHRKQSSRSYASTSSGSDLEMPARRPPREHPALRKRRSHDPPASPRDYFPPSDERRRYSQQYFSGVPYAHVPSPAPHQMPPPQFPKESRRHGSPARHSDPPSRAREKGPTPPPMKTYSGTNLSEGFAPSAEPLFATQVAHLQPQPQPAITRTYYNDTRRPSYPQRGSYAAERQAIPVRASSVRYSPLVQPDGYESRGSSRDSRHDRRAERTDSVRDARDRDLGHRYVHAGQLPAMDGVGGRRYPIEGAYR